jgi:hypothetical protein
MFFRTLLLFVLLFSLTARAQRPERLGVEVTGFPPADVADGGRVAVLQSAFKASRTLWRTADTTVSLGADIKRTDFIASDSSAWPEIDVYDVHLPLGYERTVNTNWNWRLIVSPGLGTDFERVTGDDVRWSVLGLANYVQSPDLRWVGGFYYGQAFGESRVFPAIGAVWKFAPEWTLSALMPRPSLTYAPSRPWAFSAIIQPGGGDWNIETGDGDRNLALETWRAGFETRFSPNPGLSFKVEAGYAFARSLELLDGDRSLASEDLDATPYVQIGVRLY